MLRRIFVTASIVLLALVGQGRGVAFAEDPPRLDAPIRTVGDTWTFERADGVTYVFTIVEVSESGSVIEGTNYPGLRFHRDKNDVVTSIEGNPTQVANASFIKGWRLLDFPLYVGKKWSFDVSGQTAQLKIDVVVKKFTTIKTKMGTVDAYLLETCWTNKDNKWYGCGMKYWYSPQTEHMVMRRTPSDWARSLQETDFEIIAYKLNKQRIASGK